MERISDALLTFLLNASWQILVIVSIAALAGLLMRSAPARYRHALWVSALLASLLLPAASIVPRTPTSALPSITPEVDAVLVSPSAESIERQAVEQRSVTLPVRAATVALILYGAIFVLALSRFAVAYIRTRKIRNSASPAPPPRVWDVCVREFGLRDIELLSSPRLASPAALGVFRKAVILPDNFAAEQSDELLTAAIGHETAHLARHDFAANLLYEVIHVFIAFHPASWLIRRELERTREMACDEAVTRRLMKPRTYARSIVQIAAGVKSQAQPGFTLGIFDGSTLEDRIRRVLRAPAIDVRRSRVLLATSLSVLLVGVITASGLALIAQAQSSADEHIKLGIAAYNSADYTGAARHFSDAVSASPDHTGARLYLANALMRDFYSQSNPPDSRLLTAAQQQYQEVLRRDPKNRQALAGMSSIAFDAKRFEEARQWTEKLASAHPDDKSAWYTLGVLDWAVVFPHVQTAKQAAGVPVQDYFIPDPAVRHGLRSQHLARVDQAMEHLRKAIALDAQYDEAMAYMNLLYRLKASMTDDRTEAAGMIAEADNWIKQALAIKHREKAVPESKQLSADAPPPGPAGRTTMVKAPPPPPPPPPGSDHSRQIASGLPRPPAVPGQPPSPGQYWQVLGQKDTAAIDLYRQLNAKGITSVMHLGSDKLVRVLAGPYFDDESAAKAKASVEAAGFRVLRKWE